MTEHTKKTWLEELNSKISPNAKSLDFKVKETATEVCKKILKEVNDKFQKETSYNGHAFYSEVGVVLGEIIKDLGVKV